MTGRIIIEIMDDDDLIGYGIAVVTITKVASNVEQTDYRLEPEVYGTRSQAAAAVQS